VVSVLAFSATMAITGRPGRAGFIAAMKSCFCRSAAAGSFGGGGSFSTSQPASSSNAMQATVHSRHPSRAIGRSINGTKGAV
jgi:hypothetical protein